MYFGQIIFFAGATLPPGLTVPDGALLPISGNEQLFNALGFAHSGDGTDNFRLPDCRSRVPVHAEAFGKGGAETVTLTAAQLPSHTHSLGVTASSASGSLPSSSILAVAGANTFHSMPAAKAGSLSIDSVSLEDGVISGGGAISTDPHNNMPPYRALNFGIVASGGEDF